MSDIFLHSFSIHTDASRSCQELSKEYLVAQFGFDKAKNESSTVYWHVRQSSQIVHRNAKTVDPKDDASTPVWQLETAMGAAVECFPGAMAIEVLTSTTAQPAQTSQALDGQFSAFSTRIVATIILSAGLE